MDINQLAAEIHVDNVVAGWWPEGRCLMEVCQLIITEIAEATEGERKDLMDDKLPHRKMGEVELADAMIRLLDLGGRLRLPYVDPNLTEDQPLWPKTIGGRHFVLSASVCDLGLSIHGKQDDFRISEAYSNCVAETQLVARQERYDLWGALEEKRAFNKTRADHQLANRAAPGGRKF